MNYLLLILYIFLLETRHRNAFSKIKEEDGLTLTEIKADKQPIGKYGEEKPFTNHKLQLNQGDSLYIFSDGYADQFGGENGIKYKSSKMKRFLLSIQNKPMNEQREILNQEFETWRGDLEQIDDVCVLGVRI